MKAADLFNHKWTLGGHQALKGYCKRKVHLLKFTCSKSTIDTTEKGVKYVQS